MHLAKNIDLTSGLVGGIILGVSSSAFLFLTGKITGLSGIAEGTVSIKGESWNYSYIGGLLSAGAILCLYRPASFGTPSQLSTAALLVAGLATGFGTRLAGGCTSGHGLCGLSRRSPRSLAAVLTFMATGAATAYIAGQPNWQAILTTPTDESLGPVIPAVAAVIGGLYASFNMSGIYKKLSSMVAPGKEDNTAVPSAPMHVTAFASSLLFGLGLGVSGMCNPERVLRFLDFSGSAGWDPSLAAVMGGGVLVNFLAFHYFKSANVPVALQKSKTLGAALNMGCVTCNMVMDWKLFLGSALFGFGWGLAGMCPGPAMVVAGGGGAAALKFVPSMIAGMMAKELLVG